MTRANPHERYRNIIVRGIGVQYGAVATILVMLLTAGLAHGQQVDVRVKPVGVLSPDGQRATVHVSVRCPSIGDVLEALVTVSQEATFGEAFFGPVCDDKVHGQLVRVDSLDQPFQPGTAQVSVYVLVCNDAGGCLQGDDSVEAVLFAWPFGP